MSSVKLKHSSGNGTIINGPAANPSADISLKVPSTTGSSGQVLAVASANHSSTNAELEWVANSAGTGRKILEQFYSPCDGSVIALSAGNLTLPDVTAMQDSTASHADQTGSNITYTPPTGTTQVIYEFAFYYHVYGGTSFTHHKLSIGGTEVTDARRTEGHEVQSGGITKSFKWAFNIGGSTTAATGRQASWTSGKELKWEWRHYGSGNEASAGRLAYWDGADITDVPVRPSVGITAIG